jgi:hypothetical protein
MREIKEKSRSLKTSAFCILFKIIIIFVEDLKAFWIISFGINIKEIFYVF